MEGEPKPQRIQLSRRKGWRMPPNTVKVDRTTKWGNPFIPGEAAPIGPTKGAIVADRRHAFVLYRSLAPLNEALVREARAELRGKNLACWCSLGDPYEDCCHAAVLLELANADDAFAALRETSPASPLSSASLRETGEGGEVEIISIKHDGKLFSVSEAEEDAILEMAIARSADDIADEIAEADEWRAQSRRDQMMEGF